MRREGKRKAIGRREVEPGVHGERGRGRECLTKEEGMRGEEEGGRG